MSSRPTGVGRDREQDGGPADRAYVDPSLNGDPEKVAQTIHDMAAETDSLLKEADLYGTT